MDIDFGYFFYFINSYEDEENKSDLNKFYFDLDLELRSYVDHLLKSLKGYKDQEDLLIENLILTYPKYDLVKKEFDRLFDLYIDELGGQAADQAAFIESGMDEIIQDISYSKEEIHFTFQYIRDTFLKSSLIYLYSILESHLRGLCSILKSQTGIKLDISELSNRNYLNTCYIYISKVIGLDIDHIIPYENTLKDFQNLRNILVHDFGIVSENRKKEVQKISQSYNGITIEKNKIKIEDFSILTSFLQSTILSFQELYWIIDNKLNHKVLNEKLNKGFQFLSKHISVQIKKTKFSPGLNNNKFRNKTIEFDIVYKTHKTIAKGTIQFKTHTKQTSLNIKLQRPLKVSSSLLPQFNRIIHIAKQNPHPIINGLFQNFYMIQKIPRKIEVTIMPI